MAEKKYVAVVATKDDELIKDAESWIEESRNDIDKYSEEIEQLKEAL